MLTRASDGGSVVSGSDEEGGAPANGRPVGTSNVPPTRVAATAPSGAPRKYVRPLGTDGTGGPGWL